MPETKSPLDPAREALAVAFEELSTGRMFMAHPESYVERGRADSEAWAAQQLRSLLSEAEKGGGRG